MAFDIPEDIRDDLLDLRISSNEVNWVCWDNYHLTLKYLGDSVARQAEKDVVKKLETLRFKKIDIEIHSVDFFGSSHHPRMLYAGIEKNPELMQMQRELVSSLRALDLDLEKKKFVPHVSLGRPSKKLGYERVAEFLKAFSTYRSGPISLDRFYLMESILGRNGAHYSILEEFLMYD